MRTVRKLVKKDLGNVKQLFKQYWGDSYVVTLGKVYHPDELEGFIVHSVGIEGLLTYMDMTYYLQIITLNSFLENLGIGSLLIENLVEEALNRDCSHISVTTTNDNTDALRFYQKKDFRIERIYKDAICEARKLKPSIPAIGNHGIPIRDEILLTLPLDSKRNPE